MYLLTIALIVITSFISYQGLNKEYIRDKYAFNVHRILVNKEYIRFISSGFFHVSWMHLIMNMIVLFFFGSGIEKGMGILPLGLIYFASMIGGNLLALLIHKHSPIYSSVGASGAISGLVFASIAVMPDIRIFFIPGWVFGLAYVLLTIYAIRSQRTDVGHAAHLGGGLIGMCVAIMLFPETVVRNPLPLLAVLLPGVVLIIIMIYKPDLILINKTEQRKYLEYEDRYNLSKFEKKKEIDRILEKINERGINSLTKKERELLDEYSHS